MIRLEYNYIKEYINNNNYELLSKEYISKNHKILLKCDKGHVFEMTFGNFKYNKQRCGKCSKEKEKHTYEYVKNFIESKGYTLLSKKYIHSHKKLKIKCNFGHIFNMRYNDFQTGQRCPMCSNSKQFSKPEKEIVEYVKSIYNGIIEENDRTVIKNPKTGKYLELDIYLPELNKAIEYNGKYWHSNNNAILRDTIKQKQCKEKGINIIIIQEEKWNKNYSLINNFLG